MMAVGEIGPEAADAALALSALLKDENSFYRRVAATSLGPASAPVASSAIVSGWRAAISDSCGRS